MKKFKKVILGTLVLTSLSSFANDKAYFLQGEQIAINGFAFAASSSENSVCRALGYEKAAAGAAQVIDSESSDLLVQADYDSNTGKTVINEGYSGARSSMTKISEIVCVNRISESPLFEVVLESPIIEENMRVAVTGTNHSGVCKYLGYDHAANNAIITSETTENIPLVNLNYNGVITGGRRSSESLVLESLLCINDLTDNAN